MNIIQCRFGHYYDHDVFAECPHCAKQANAVSPSPLEMNRGIQDNSETVLVRQPFQWGGEDKEKEDNDRTVLFHEDDVAPSGLTYGQEKERQNVSFREESESETTLLTRDEWKRGLIVGWLIGVTGSAYGQFYPLFTDNNWVGTDKENQLMVGIQSDGYSCVNCVISFDMKSKEFFVNGELRIANKATTPIYVDGDLIDGTKYLKDQDILEIEGLQYELIKLCKDGFSWWKEKKKTGRTEMLTIDDVMGQPSEDSQGEYWNCPVCSARNHRLQRYCLTCGRSRF